MKQAVLIHNPTAGSGEHSKERLVKKIETAGYEVEYFSTDIPGWERFIQYKAEVIFLAGGDGTVQKLAAELLKAGDPVQKVPVQILPMGTANNIASTLGLNTSVEKLVKLQKWESFDAGEVEWTGDSNFFIEGIGFGIFPRLVKVMKERKKEEGEPEGPEVELKQSLQQLLQIVRNYEACEAIIITDGEEITGKFLLIELMNIRFIGPNFDLAPTSRINDGKLELVAIPEEARENLENYIQDLLNDNRKASLEDFTLLRKISMGRLKWFGGDMHIDDERIENYQGEEVKFKINEAAFNFRVRS
ncbi:diacylglycerol/lipid kinase family protein [Salinimicrobium sp. TH3]|uniref:diacylglycerol/lipid kinase family protein n=1 Tax=Salinimicrobium sp. TH3 TaxID=2997342 RepID=UPI00227262DC|nr:diacylglycerol kinase family protein [Salinimicrobium sp. TH3]MCY2688709.1 diacylglycerol kinase family protein [Salinimicrobium sp. TH3]